MAKTWAVSSRKPEAAYYAHTTVKPFSVFRLTAHPVATRRSGGVADYRSIPSSLPSAWFSRSGIPDIWTIGQIKPD